MRSGRDPAVLFHAVWIIVLFDVEPVSLVIGQDRCCIIEGHRVLVEVRLSLHRIPLESVVKTQRMIPYYR